MSRKPTKNNKLKELFLNRTGIVAICFCLIFGGLGGYLIRSSFAASANYGCAPNTYSQGSSGTCVKVIQEIINQVVSSTLPHPGMHSLNVDGDYGPLTFSDVKLLQKDTGFPASEQDGTVGPYTWDHALCRDVSVLGPLWLNSQANCQRYEE
jgi:hypothetical protein